MRRLAACPFATIPSPLLGPTRSLGTFQRTTRPRRIAGSRRVAKAPLERFAGSRSRSSPAALRGAGSEPERGGSMKSAPIVDAGLSPLRGGASWSRFGRQVARFLRASLRTTGERSLMRKPRSAECAESSDHKCCISIVLQSEPPCRLVFCRGLAGTGLTVAVC